MPGSSDRWILPSFIIALFLLCAALWSLAVPAFECPDEPGHARFVNFLYERSRLPVPGDEAPGEAHQPPLYYALAAAVTRLGGLGPIDVRPVRNPAFHWYGGDDQNKYLHPPSESPPLAGSARALHALRLLSVALAGATVALVFLMGSAGGAPPGVCLAAMMLAAFIPQFTFVAGSLNNDNLANLLSAACLACLAAAAAGPARLGLWAAAGGLAGLGLLSKFTGLALLPCGLIAAALSAGQPGPSARWRAGAFLAPALAMPLPLFIRNQIVLGDPLGAAAQLQTLPQLVDRKSLASTYFLTEFPSVLFRSFWGTFGWMSLRMPSLFYAGCLLLVLGAVTGLAIMRRDATTRRMHILFGCAVGAQLAQVAVYNLTFTQAQGRFLFPAMGPIALLMASGLGEITRRAGLGAPGVRWVVPLAAALAAGNVLILRFVVIPAYGGG